MEDTGEDRAGLPDKEICLVTGDEKAGGISRRHSTSSSTSQDQVRQPVLDESRPVIWIPDEGLGISDEEVRQTREIHGAEIPRR
jgi:hypothetical protein